MRCYLYRGGHIAGVEVLTADSDDALIRQARAAFEKRGKEFDGFEVWDHARIVYQYPEPPHQSANTGPNALFYRLYFLGEDGFVVGQYDFPAESDGAAIEVAQLVFDAVSDRALRFEVWHGARLVDPGEREAEMRPLEQVAADRQAQVVKLEERIRDSNSVVASSQHLLERLKALKLPATRQTATDAVASDRGGTSGGAQGERT